MSGRRTYKGKVARVRITSIDGARAWRAWATEAELDELIEKLNAVEEKPRRRAPVTKQAPRRRRRTPTPQTTKKHKGGRPKKASVRTPGHVGVIVVGGGSSRRRRVGDSQAVYRKRDGFKKRSSNNPRPTTKVRKRARKG